MGCFYDKEGEVIMPSDWVFIAISILSLAGIYLISQANLRNYFKKMNFKQQIKVENLKLKQLEKELGLKGKTRSVASEPANNDISDLVSYSIDRYMNKDEDDDSSDWLTDIISNAAKNNPELVQQVIGRLTSGKGGDEQQQIKVLGD